MNPIRDHSRLFTRMLLGAWLFIVATPLIATMLANHALGGLPLIGVVTWFTLLRVARWLSPPARADRLMRRGRYSEALRLCDEALALQTEGAWLGARRLVWLNRRTSALLGAGRPDDALVSALEAIEISADPETLGNCAMALVRLNRYDEAIASARLALSLSRERSVVGNAALALALMTKGLPAEAEALARAGIEDSNALLPFVRAEHYVLCLAVLARALRVQAAPAVVLTQPGGDDAPGGRVAPSSRPMSAAAASRLAQAERYLKQLRDIASGSPYLRAILLMEEADRQSDGAGAVEQVLASIAEARTLAPGYVTWFITQPGTLGVLRENSQVAPVVAVATAEMAERRARVPSTELVALEMMDARRDARARPAAQSSREAMLVQVATLAGTFVLLLLWAYHFFLAA